MYGSGRGLTASKGSPKSAAQEHFGGTEGTRKRRGDQTQRQQRAEGADWQDPRMEAKEDEAKAQPED